jgi:hypothetical protein
LRKHPDAKAGIIPMHANPDPKKLSHNKGVTLHTFFEALLERLCMESPAGLFPQ